MKAKGFFIASTGQNIGKTTTSLGLVAGLTKRGFKTGFMKPVGQEHVTTEGGAVVDKDVLLFKECFSLKDRDIDLSPVLIPSGFTKDFLDEKIDSNKLSQAITSSYKTLSKHYDYMVVEGTGHVGVGSIVDLNNAQVASQLKLPVILIASGGLGSSFDELTLSKMVCDAYSVPIIGVILNRVKEDKREMIALYMQKALTRWGLPLLGCIPYDTLLSLPTMQDLEILFKTSLITCASQRLRHFQEIRLVAAPLEIYREMILPHEVIITPANREDIILSTLSKYWEMKQQGKDLGAGFVLTGEHAPRHFIIEQIEKAGIPMLYTPLASHTALQMLHHYTAKIRKEDKEKIEEAIDVVEKHIDFSFLLKSY